MVSAVTTAAHRRIISFDIMRGLFLTSILINHIELYPSLFDLATGRGRLYVSVAEGFFFLSGLLIGMIHRRKAERGTKFVFRSLWTRALELYVASVVLTLLFSYWAVVSGHEGIKYGLPADPINWWHTIWETLFMRYGFGWADFLARFSLLLLIAPFIVTLLVRGWWKIALIIIGAMWLFRGQNFTYSWQIIFNGGIVAGFYWQQIIGFFNGLPEARRKLVQRTTIALAAVTFTASWLSVFVLSLFNERLSSLPMWLQHFTVNDWNKFNDYTWIYAQKWTMGPLRVALFVLWFAVLYMFVEKYEERINKISRGLFVLLGSNSLFVYVTHAFIVFAFKLFIPIHTTLWQNFLITFAAFWVLVGLTMLYKSIDRKAIKRTISKSFVRVVAATDSK